MRRACIAAAGEFEIAFDFAGEALFPPRIEELIQRHGLDVGKRLPRSGFKLHRAAQRGLGGLFPAQRGVTELDLLIGDPQCGFDEVELERFGLFRGLEGRLQRAAAEFDGHGGLAAFPRGRLHVGLGDLPPGLLEVEMPHVEAADFRLRRNVTPQEGRDRIHRVGSVGRVLQIGHGWTRNVAA
jgi:hypothetical protein